MLGSAFLVAGALLVSPTRKTAGYGIRIFRLREVLLRTLKMRLL